MNSGCNRRLQSQHFPRISIVFFLFFSSCLGSDYSRSKGQIMHHTSSHEASPENEEANVNATIAMEIAHKRASEVKSRPLMPSPSRNRLWKRYRFPM